MALLAHPIGAYDQAVAHFDEAIALCRQAGYQIELVCACCDYAHTPLQVASTATRPDQDRQRATAMLDWSQPISREPGMRLLMDPILSRSEIQRE